MINVRNVQITETADPNFRLCRTASIDSLNRLAGERIELQVIAKPRTATSNDEIRALNQAQLLIACGNIRQCHRYLEQTPGSDCHVLAFNSRVEINILIHGMAHIRWPAFD